ncbi:MAG: primosomal protein N' [Treponema sp.]|jgi:primosomal protein N' (replication factor Y)|nr:primosomal protein N' [Treponema sp.]
MNESSYVDIIFDVPLKQTYSYRKDEKQEASVGKRAMVPFGKREALGYIIAERDNPPEGVENKKIKTIRRVVDKEAVFDEDNIALAKWMASYYLCGPGEALAAMIPQGRRTGSYPSFADDDLPEKRLELSDEQRRALDGIAEMAAARKSGLSSPEMAYLYGITGSGKTEVFLRTAEKLLDAGKTVIYLVPEISLTRQTSELMGRRFGSAAATLHSGMTGSQRLTEWMRIRRGEAGIVVGPRSAVFAPLRNLGLIIIDEEHDGSYKSGNTPRYHARQIAMRRSSSEGALLLMGSATPSAEAWKLMNDGTIRRFYLSQRLSGGKLPEIFPVNLAKTEGCLTRELKDEIRVTSQMGRQTILFLNRRGFGYFYQCRSCGFELTCRHCSVSLTYHKSRNRAVCHYCGYQIKPPEACPECGSLDAGFRGFGTELIEEEVRNSFPDLKIGRVDADTTKKKGSLEQLLGAFKAGELDILLGTQMVAKGLNFPGVRLVGVVFADTGLHLPDFRAAERTFSLIVQVAGRAGRYFPDGKVIVQTLRPSDPAISRACSLDVEGFFAAELLQRSELGFPPYSRLIRFTVRSRSAEKAKRAAARLAVLVKPALPPGAELLGPCECAISLRAGSYRHQILLRGKTMGPLHKSASFLLESYGREKEAGVYVEADVDPMDLL